MPSKTLTPEEKAKVTSAIPTSSNKIFAAVPARIYVAHPQRDRWSYSGLQGALAFTHDRNKDAFVLKLVDFIGTRGVIWQHELYDQFEYHKDRPFFHSFAGDECMIGVVFAEEKDATSFYKKVAARKVDKATKAPSEPKKVRKGGKIDKSMISAPREGSFLHVAHVGFDEEKGFTSNNVDESWLSLVRDLQNQGVTAEVIEQNRDFIQDFVRQAKQQVNVANATEPAPKKKPPPPVPRRGAHVTSSSVTSTNGDPARPGQPSRSVMPAPPQLPQRSSVAPPHPPAPPPPAVRPNIPPPPPRPVSSPSPPLPPAPVVRPTTSLPARPPPPVRPQNGAPLLAPPPPPPPPPPSRTGGIPPPPPAVQEDSPPPPPPPPPPPAAPPPPAPPGTMPPPQPGRADLLASIRGQSVANLRKAPAPASTPPPPPAAAAEEPSRAGGGGGGDLTAALAAALMQRNKKLGDSDEEDEDEWD